MHLRETSLGDEAQEDAGQRRPAYTAQTPARGRTHQIPGIGVQACTPHQRLAEDNELPPLRRLRRGPGAVLVTADWMDYNSGTADERSPR